MKMLMRLTAGLFLGFLLSVSMAASGHGPNAKDRSPPAQVPPIPQPLIVSVVSMPAQPHESPSFWDRLIDPSNILAIVTVGLVFFTWRLASQTGRLADEAKETGAKTMRAYVGVSLGQFGAPITGTAPGCREMQFDLTNTGQTPAKKVEFWYQLVSFPANGKVPVTNTLFFPQSRLDPPRFFPEIGAGKSVPVRFTLIDPAEVKQVDDAAAALSGTGGNAIAILGVVIYRDVFDKLKKKTFFKRVVTDNHQALKATVDHDEST